MSPGTAESGSSKPATLVRRPEAITLSVETLLDHVRAGRIRVPRFQRPLRWDANDIKLLFDSIYRGYPVGTLLFWKKPADAARLEIGPMRLDAPARQDAFWVVDGQQRITALAAVLLGVYQDGTDAYELFFDLQSPQPNFVRASTRNPPNPNWLPLNQVADSAALLTWLHERSTALDRAAVSAAIELGKRVREYQLPAYVVDTEDEDRLRDIFDRSNSGGKPLKKDEVFDALHGASAHSPGDLKELANTLSQTGFGQLDGEFLLRVMLAVQGKDPSLGFKGNIESEQVSAALADTEQALKRVFVFLRTHATIPHLSLMPYRLPTITLARFFHLHPEPVPRSVELLSRWLWRGAISGRHQGGTAATRKTLNAIGADEANAVQALLGDVGQRPEALAEPTSFRFSSAQAKMQVLALWALRPRHFQTGKHLRIEDIVGANKPAIQIRPPADKELQLAYSVANRLLHPPLAGGLYKHLRAQSDRAILDSHGISSDAHAALCDGDFAQFLTLRQDYLIPRINRFLARHAKWDASDRPPLTQLVISDDELPDDDDGDRDAQAESRRDMTPTEPDTASAGQIPLLR